MEPPTPPLQRDSSVGSRAVLTKTTNHRPFNTYLVEEVGPVGSAHAAARERHPPRKLDARRPLREGRRRVGFAAHVFEQAADHLTGGASALGKARAARMHY
jgi:hypothetical protein